jgi:hypothetical protein
MSYGKFQEEEDAGNAAAAIFATAKKTLSPKIFY